jgi:hypothetical protein
MWGWWSESPSPPQIQKGDTRCFSGEGDPGVGGEEVPGGEIQVPKRCHRTEFQLEALHGDLEELASEGGAGAMPHDGLEVLDSLRGVKVVEVEPLHSQGAMDNGLGHVALDVGFGEASLEDGLHEVMALATGQSCDHQWVFHCLHDGVILTIPSIMLGHVFGGNGICPLGGFGKEELELFTLDAIRTGHGTQQFTGFMSFQMGDEDLDPVRA